MPILPLHHHIIFVSDQAVPTILGASLPGAVPAHIHAVVTPAMREAGTLLEEALRLRGSIRCTQYPLEDNLSQDAMYSVLDAIRNSIGEETFGVNLTGGTKLMALAAAEWAYAYDVPAFYIDTVKGQFIQIGRTWHYAPLPDVLSIRDLLSANAFSIESADTSPVPKERRELLIKLLECTCTHDGEKALGRLNWLAEQAQGNLRVYDDCPMEPAWEKVMTLCSCAGTLQRRDNELLFPNENARRWCNGVWLEEYVKATLYHLHACKKIKDWASSVRVRHKGILNELDALFSVHNRLFIIECKTTCMVKKPMQPDNATLYKADSLHDRLGGVFAKAMLCSVRPLADKDKERAKKQLQVHIVSGNDLLRLADILTLWSQTP